MVKEGTMKTEFVPTYGNLIKELDNIIKDIPPYLRNDYAKFFSGTEIQKLLFGTADFEEEASQWARDNFWSEPS